MLVSACLYALLAYDRCSLEFRNSVQKSWLLPCKVPPSICEIFETVLAFERGYGDRRSLPSRSYVVLRVGHSVSYFYGATSCSLRLQLCKPALGLFLGCLSLIYVPIRTSYSTIQLFPSSTRVARLYVLFYRSPHMCA